MRLPACFTSLFYSKMGSRANKTANRGRVTENYDINRICVRK